MALIKLTASELENVQSQITKLSDKASDCSNTVASVKNGLDMEVSAKRNIEGQLDAIKRDLLKHSEDLKSYANVLNDVVNEFVSTDNKGIASNVPNIANVISAVAGVGAIGGLGTYGGYQWVQAHKEVSDKILKNNTGINSVGAMKTFEQAKNAGLLFGKTSLEKSETSFFGNLWNKGKEALDAVGDKVKDTVDAVSDKVKETYGNVVQAGKDCVSWVKENYENKGITYTVAQYAKAFGKVAAGGAMLAATVATAGTMAGITGVYGVDSLVNGIVDIGKISYNVSVGKTAEIEETQLLKDGMEFIAGGVGGAVGEAFGNAELGEEIGEKIASLTYDGGKIASSIYTISTGWDKIQQATDFNFSGVAGEFKQTTSGLWDMATKVDIRDLKCQYDLFKTTIPNTINAFDNISLINSLASSIVADPVDVIGDLIKGNDLEFGGIIGQVKEVITSNF